MGEMAKNELYFGLFKQFADMPIAIAHQSYYDRVFAAIYDHFSYQVSAELEFYMTAIPYDDANILEIGCGSGRLTVPLLKRGYQIDAIDLSEAMLARFKERLANLPERMWSRCRVIQADIYDFVPDKKYDFIFIPATSMCILASNCAQMEALVTRIYDMLNPGGIFAFDFREYPNHVEKKCSDVYTDYFEREGSENILLYQEFNNYVPGYSIVNYYLEEIKGDNTFRYICTASKKILTRKMISKAMSATSFSLTRSDSIIYSDTIMSRLLCYEK